MQTRRLPLVAVLVALVLLVGGLTREDATQAGDAGVPAAGRTADIPVPPDQGALVPSADERAGVAQALLDRQADAIKRGDLRTFVATIDPEAIDFRDRQAEAFAFRRAVPLDLWAYEVTEIAPFELTLDRRAELGADSFTARVAVRYRLAGHDRGAAEYDAYLTFVSRRGSWYVADDTDGDRFGYRTPPQLWDLGPVTVARGERSLVLGVGENSTMKRYAALADTAVARVTAVWGSDWAGEVVVLAPDTQQHMAALLGADEERYDQLAALTRADTEGAAVQRAADRIVINPALWRKLNERGQRIVMAHEVTHVATRSSTTTAVPVWLSEGFADYVGYLGSDVPRQTAAEEFFAVVREKGAPETLPADEDFDPHAPALATAYQQAWLAAVLIAETHGTEPLVEFYREVGTPDGSAVENLDAAFRDVLGTTMADFTDRWRSYVEEQAE